MMNAPVGSRRPGAGGILSFRSKQLKKGMTRNQLLDGGSIAQLRTAVNLTGGEASDDEQRLGVDVAGDYKINYGMGMAADPRLRAALIRENFFLSVLIPRTRHVMLRSVAAFFTWPRTLVIIGLTAIYVSCAYACAYTHPNGLGNTFCNGGPIGNGGEQRAFTFVDYRAAILNSLAAMLLSFYVSAVVTMYKEAYMVCASVKSQMMQFMSFCASEMGDQPGGREVLLDLWRSLNLMHLSTYCLADEKRLVYSFDGFLIPIAQAFGPTDGGEQQGMFRRAELVGLGKEYMIPTAAVRFPVPAMSTSEIHDQYTEEPTFRDGRASDETARADKLIGDVRGDLRSDAALCYQMYTGRLNRLVRECLKYKLSGAAWPVWGSLLNGVVGSMAELQRRAHYRMPKIYRMSVQFVVLTTLAADSFIIGTVVGRIFEQEYAYAIGAAAFATILLLTLTIPTTLLVAACIDMEEPWGDNMMDVPGISYVRTAAEVTLNIAAPHPATEPAVSAAMRVDVQGAVQRGSARRPPGPGSLSRKGTSPTFAASAAFSMAAQSFSSAAASKSSSPGDGGSGGYASEVEQSSPTSPGAEKEKKRARLLDA